MKDEVKGQLESLFAQDKQKTNMADQEKVEQVAQAEKNDAEFLRIRDVVIVPAMREMADFIAAQGWGSDISIEEGQTDSRGHKSPAKIALTFFRGSIPAYYSGHEYPYVWAVHSRGSAGVWFPTSTISPGRGGSSSSGTGAHLADVTVEMVQRHIVAVLSRVLKGLP
ncbi:hypothetical protein [Novosphingobium sp. Fuku2-ISO-50]|uniref:hypothetical protein n=1 Tax=Novosphingobium sp. Fuku2-ISO-50 TaxID=1739114 RepID=UPI00076D6D66|nr:hypothetical protein [Novosphingobium sp. Fuku2-ISO-50]KUR75362.1 hypothetical protein AQZ50_16025 [Novosphingobium sp. Fuku2-ISO-50]